MSQPYSYWKMSRNQADTAALTTKSDNFLVLLSLPRQSIVLWSGLFSWCWRGTGSSVFNQSSGWFFGSLQILQLVLSYSSYCYVSTPLFVRRGRTLSPWHTSILDCSAKTWYKMIVLRQTLLFWEHQAQDASPDTCLQNCKRNVSR